MAQDEGARVGEFFAGLIREVLAAGWRYDRERRLWLLPSGEVVGSILGRVRGSAGPPAAKPGTVGASGSSLRPQG